MFAIEAYGYVLFVPYRSGSKSIAKRLIGTSHLEDLTERKIARNPGVDKVEDINSLIRHTRFKDSKKIIIARKPDDRFLRCHATFKYLFDDRTMSAHADSIYSYIDVPHNDLYYFMFEDLTDIFPKAQGDPVNFLDATVDNPRLKQTLLGVYLTRGQRKYCERELEKYYQFIETANRIYPDEMRKILDSTHGWSYFTELK